MSSISIFLRIFFQNIEYIAPVILVFLLITFVGASFFVKLIKEDKWYVIIPAGALTGVFGFILVLGVFSYFFKARLGIWVLFLVFLVAGLILAARNKKLFPKIKVQSNWKKVLVYLTYLLIAGFLLFLVGVNIYGGDVIAYWGFATSFANGNYPIISPWQPDLLSVHHQGTYMFEGAVHAITGADMKLVHSLYSYLVVLSGLFLLWGWTRKKTNYKFLSILPALVAYFSFGAAFLPLPNSLRSFFNPEVEHITSRLPLFLDAKNRLGGASNLPEFIYINHRAAAFAGVALIIILILSKARLKDRFKPILVAGLSVPVISSDEIYLPVIATVVLVWFFHTLFKEKKRKQKKVVLNFVLAGLVFLALFFVVGNAMRDSLLLPSKEAPRFKVTLDKEVMTGRMTGMKTAILRQNETLGYFWFLPDLRVFMVLAFLFAILSKERWTIYTFLGTLGVLFAYLTVQHTFYKANQDRFLHVLYHFYGIIIAYASVFILRYRKGIWIKLFSYLVMTLLFTSVVFAVFYLFPLVKKPDYPNLRGELPRYEVLKWIRKNIARQRVFFLDGYLNNVSYSHLTLVGIQNYGLFVPVSPADIKVHTPDYGIEAIDLINTLNPSSLEELKVDYLYVGHDQLEFYSLERRRDLSDNNYFSPVYSDDKGVLYKVNEKYLGEGRNFDDTIMNLADLVTNQDNIYLDYPPRMNYSIRAALMLALNDKGNLYTEWRQGAFNYIETEIKFEEPSPAINYDYLVLGPETSPEEICDCKSFNKIWETNGIVAYKVQ